MTAVESMSCAAAAAAAGDMGRRGAGRCAAVPLVGAPTWGAVIWKQWTLVASPASRTADPALQEHLGCANAILAFLQKLDHKVSGTDVYTFIVVYVYQQMSPGSRSVSMGSKA